MLSIGGENTIQREKEIEEESEKTQQNRWPQTEKKHRPQMQTMQAALPSTQDSKDNLKVFNAKSKQSKDDL